MPAYDTALFTPPAPLARVKLRNSDSGDTMPDVPMLIDCGADVTLIPRASASLGAFKKVPPGTAESTPPSAHRSDAAD